MNYWYNLRQNKCPKCNKLLGFNKEEEMIYCKDLHCGFQISQYRMEAIITQMNSRPFIQKSNFDDLQSLGQEELPRGEKMQYLDI